MHVYVCKYMCVDMCMCTCLYVVYAFECVLVCKESIQRSTYVHSPVCTFITYFIFCNYHIIALNFLSSLSLQNLPCTLPCCPSNLWPFICCAVRHIYIYF